MRLRPRLAPGAVGRWVLLGPAELRRSSFDSFDALSAALIGALPLVRRGGQIQQCALPTADPPDVEVVLPMLLIAGSEQMLMGALERVGLPG